MIHLRSLPFTPPASATGKVAWAWNEIEACLGSGMRMREVWEAAKLDGLEIPYPQFRVYVSRLRRRKQFLRNVRPPLASDERLQSSDPSSSDPLRNLREQREKKKQSGFDYDPFSIHRDLID